MARLDEEGLKQGMEKEKAYLEAWHEAKKQERIQWLQQSTEKQKRAEKSRIGFDPSKNTFFSNLYLNQQRQIEARRKINEE